jgi:hypothetical protein
MSPLFKKITVGIFVTTGLLMSMSAFAIEYKALTTIPGVSERDKNIKNPAELVTGVYNAAIGIGAILAVIMIIIGGMKYTTSEAINTKTGAKEQIQDALLGLVLLLGSFLILKTINKDLVNLAVTLPVGEGNNLSELQVQRDQAIAITATNKKYQEELSKEKVLRENLASVDKQRQDLKNKIEIAKNGGVVSTTEIASLQKELDGLNGLYETTAKQATDIRNSAEEERLAMVRKVNLQQMTDAAAKGDTEEAIRIAQKLNQIEQAEIDRKKQAGVDVDVVKSAEATQKTTLELSRISIGTETALNNLSTGKYPTRSADGQNNFFTMRSNYVNEMSSVYTQISKLDPVKANEYRVTALESLKKIDAKWSQNLGCSNGFVSSSQGSGVSYSCK